MKSLLCAAGILLAGCVNPFAPHLDDSADGGGTILGDQRTLDGVLQNFKQSYVFKDTTIYGQIISPSFIFVYRDYEKGVDVFWGRDDEMRSTHGLFQNAQRLDLVWNNTIALTGDSVKMNITKNFNLTVTFNPSDIVRIDGYASLTVERAKENEIWRITRWRDESNF